MWEAEGYPQDIVYPKCKSVWLNIEEHVNRVKLERTKRTKQNYIRNFLFVDLYGFQHYSDLSKKHFDADFRCLLLFAKQQQHELWEGNRNFICVWYYHIRGKKSWVVIFSYFEASKKMDGNNRNNEIPWNISICIHSCSRIILFDIFRWWNVVSNIFSL